MRAPEPPRERLTTLRPTPSLRVILIKIVSLGLLDALVLYALFVLLMSANYVWFAAALVGIVAINVIYFSKRLLPAKYLAPGLVFLLIFQVFVVGYSAYIAFTNYGDGHNGTKQDAITGIVQNSLTRVRGSATYPVTVVQRGSDLGLLTTVNGKVEVGDAKTPLHVVTNATVVDGKPTAVPGYSTLSFQQLLNTQSKLAALAVPISSNPNSGALRTADGSSAFLYRSDLKYSAANDTFTSATKGTVYRDNGKGSFADSSGTKLTPGWTVTVGFANFVQAFTDPTIRGPLVSTIIWTFVFAILSTFLTFPGFLSALVWAGLMNPQFGFINQVLLGGADVPWLTDPTLAKISILIVNTWLGFPYMFLVCTGALQAVPEEVIEASRVDGAKPWAQFRLIKLPLLMVSLAPLLISTFAFNFNNFNLIYLLTGGGPTDVSAGINAGSTDILITLVYKVAFDTASGRNYGLASAFAILIFLVVATVSVIGFRQTKALEEIN
jgi:arabinogalactan oligomer/maltooligosaccharide transport system permease protein